MTKRPNTSPPQPDGPAKILPTHERSRTLSVAAGMPKGWRNNSPLEIAYLNGQLARGIIRRPDGTAKYTAKDRWNAGDDFRKQYEAAQPSTRDSTDMDVVRGGQGAAISVAMQKADRWLNTVRIQLNAQDRRIIERVCGEGFWPSEAVAEACGPAYKYATIPRLNEALDNLCEAVATMRELGER